MFNVLIGKITEFNQKSEKESASLMGKVLGMADEKSLRALFISAQQAIGQSLVLIERWGRFSRLSV
jgi:hypothetical protein